LAERRKNLKDMQLL